MEDKPVRFDGRLVEKRLFVMLPAAGGLIGSDIGLTTNSLNIVEVPSKAQLAERILFINLIALDPEYFIFSIL